MNIYILLNEKKESIVAGSDSLIVIDGRLNDRNKAKQAIEALKRKYRVKPHLIEEAKYISKLDSGRYDSLTGKYVYSNLIQL